MILRSRLRFAVAAALPPTGNVQGDGLVLSTDGHLYIWDGTAWVGNTPVADGELVTAGVGPFDDLDPQGNRVLAFSGLATLSGILAPTGNALRSHILVCPSGLNVEHEGAGSAAANRVELGIYVPGPLAIYTCHIVYDSITQRWRLASAP